MIFHKRGDNLEVLSIAVVSLSAYFISLTLLMGELVSSVREDGETIMAIDAALLGIATGITVDQARHLVEKPDDHPDHPFAHLITELRETNRLLREITAAAELYKKPPLTQVIIVKPDPIWFKLDKFGRTHNSILSPATNITLTFDIAGVGRFNSILGMGWNELDLPDGTLIALQSAGTQQPLIYRCANEGLGSAIFARWDN